MGNVELTYFNSIIEISVGISMAYVIIKDKWSDYSFFSLLSQIMQHFTNRVMQKKTQKLQALEVEMTKIRFLITLDNLDLETKGALDFIHIKSQKIVDKVNYIEEKFSKRLLRITKVKYMGVYSFDCLFFGLLLLIEGPLQKHFKTNCSDVIEVGIILLCIFSVHCIVFECMKKLDSHFLRPTMLLHGMLFVIAIIVCKIGMLQCFLNIREDCIVYMSLVFCFMNFIIYFIYDIVSSFISFLIVSFKISLMHLNKIAEELRSDVDMYKDKFVISEEALSVAFNTSNSGIVANQETSV